MFRMVGLGFTEGWFVAYSRLLSGSERVSSGDQRMRRVKDQDEEGKGPGDQEDPGTRGPEDQGTKGPRDQGTRGPGDQRTKGPEDRATKGSGEP